MNAEDEPKRCNTEEWEAIRRYLILKLGEGRDRQFKNEQQEKKDD